ncbi:MAG: glycosyltransferase family A protein [Flavobacterium sp.]|uniref:glycosyltransferase family 2 protein n=1 Tax=Flavobacterium sp. TaxID=239 RepID=UPI002733B1A1|nr:glycosyltransferase family A protein [Flavobacterium sp.]MDP3679666.1 glycosyltransferase family A protein [Flavobacterium sp.]MDZ4331086.1 glycosyltransferase family A protein [Flavobacterium sp.]
MIVVYHQNNRVNKVISVRNELITFDLHSSIAEVLMMLAHQFPEKPIVWCHQLLENSLNIDKMTTFFHHNKMMLSYDSTLTSFLGNGIGFVEESPFIKVNKKCTYPTWLMSSKVGVIHASSLKLIGGTIKADANFDYFLNSVSKVGMILGLLCYSEPKLLLKNAPNSISRKANLFILFRFVKQHYKKRWIVLLFLNLLIFEKRFPIFPFLYSLFFKNRKKTVLNLDSIPVESTLTVIDKKTIDVIIPTIGRKQYLYDVLQDLAQQKHLPVNVIIVEQNPQSGSISELHFLTNETWPFNIKHTFTHQAGACNARNLALSQVESEWVFLNDDDNRFDERLLETFLNKVRQYGVYVLTTAYLQQNEPQRYSITNQSGIFGSGNSFVKASCLVAVSFDMALEFGYGEDIDFGMQLRNNGFDIIYFPEIRILHLKAPMGGFRIKVKQLWDTEKIQPKPSPTIMYVFLKHYTQQQLSCYKLVSFFKIMKKESVSNYRVFFNQFEKKWNLSYYWANKL